MIKLTLEVKLTFLVKIMKRIKLCLTAGLISAFLTGCVNTQQVTAGDGQSAFSVDCSGPLGNWKACYEKIGDVCGAYGYTVLRSSLDGNVIRGKESSERTILARCSK